MATRRSKSGNSNRRRSRKNERQEAFEKRFKWKLGLLLVIVVFGSTVLVVGKTQIFKWLMDWRSYTVNKSSEPESRVYDAINLSFDIRSSDYKRTQLFELLNDPVKWYNLSLRLNHRFPSEAKYDVFRYLVKPEVTQIDFGGSNYEIKFHGIYRYRVPKKELFVFESGVAFIENGLITSLTTENYPNEYHLDWINHLWRWYLLYCVGISLLAGAIILFARIERDLLLAMSKRWFGV